MLESGMKFWPFLLLACAFSMGEDLVLHQAARVSMPEGVDSGIKEVALYHVPESHSYLLVLNWEFDNGHLFRTPIATMVFYGLCEGEDALQLCDITGDDMPELVVKGMTATGDNQHIRIYQFPKGASKYQPDRVARQLLQTVARGIKIRDDKRIILQAGYREEYSTYRPSSTIYEYSGDELVPLPPEGKTSCPAGWEEREVWAVNLKGEPLRLKAAVKEVEDPATFSLWKGIPPELLPEGTEAAEDHPAYRFSDSSGRKPNRRIYSQLGQLVAPLLPYRVTGGMAKGYVPTLEWCATETRRGLLPAYSKNRGLVVIDTANPEREYTILPPVWQELPTDHYQPDTAVSDTIRWLDDSHFVLVRWRTFAFSWVVYELKDDAFRQVASGAHHYKLKDHDSPTLVVRDGKLLAIRPHHGLRTARNAQTPDEILFDKNWEHK